MNDPALEMLARAYKTIQNFVEEDDYDMNKDPDWLNNKDREWGLDTGARWPAIGVIQ